MDAKIKKLRSEGTTIRPSIIIGKNGLTEQAVANIKNELKKSSLIKIRFLSSYMDGKDKKAEINDLIEKTSSRLVQFIGFTVVLTRK